MTAFIVIGLIVVWGSIIWAWRISNQYEKDKENEEREDNAYEAWLDNSENLS